MSIPHHKWKSEAILCIPGLELHKSIFFFNQITRRQGVHPLKVESGKKKELGCELISNAGARRI